MKGHTSFVNSVDCSRGSKPLVVSGGDDCQVKLSEYLDPRNLFNPKHCNVLQVKVWDRRRRQPLSSLNSTYQVCSTISSIYSFKFQFR